ncbi:hypothetical protein B7R74_10890 [Yersinia pseudotuberculosis]|uniref:hypothetical protein n=1 Tax=Yersinia pseudotuberculosis complex TaxID=1649845 RepID=UPI0003FF9E99|nr:MULTISPECIES: hypothetical protein [Yersinia pseudotuberculosis complex]PSH20933.1 hypothetical protein B7R74_10890 [Yersinia pseudotuberculosis]
MKHLGTPCDKISNKNMTLDSSLKNAKVIEERIRKKNGEEYKFSHKKCELAKNRNNIKTQRKRLLL